MIHLYKEMYIVGGHLVPRIFSDNDIKRPVNVPLTPLEASLKRVHAPLIIPSFFIYKTSSLVLSDDQGSCGCCWAFATCNVLADRLSIMTNGQTIESLSIQQLLSCTNDMERCNIDNDCNGCQGGSPEKAFKWILQQDYYLTPISKGGLEYEQNRKDNITSSCPLVESDDGVSIKKGTIYSLVTFIEEQGYDKNILENNIKNMKYELLTGGTFFSTMTVYEDFYNYTGSAIYKSNKEDIVGGHAVEVIGYCEKGIDKRHGFKEAYWICRNSWGKLWPKETQDSGYFAILMGVNECGIESRCGSADPLWKRNLSGNYNINHSATSYSDYNTFIKNLIGTFTTK